MEENRFSPEENALYETVNEHPGSSIYGLAKEMDWSTGKTSHILDKLEEKGLTKSELKVEGGRAKRKINPVPWQEITGTEKSKIVQVE